MVLRELFARLGLQVDEGGFRKAEGRIGVLRGALQTLGMGFGLGAGTAGFQLLLDTVKKVTGAVGEVANEARETDRAATRIGLTTEAYQELGYAAKVSGISVESMERSLRFLSRAAYASGLGTHALSYEFGRLHIPVRGRTPDQILMDTARAFQKMPPGVERTATAMKLFGRNGSELLPLLVKGPAGIKALREEAHRLGVVFSQEDIQTAKRYGIATKRLQGVMQGVKRALVMPFLAWSAENRTRIADWVLNNADRIRWATSGVAEHALGIFEAIANAAKSIGSSVANGFLAFIRWMVDIARSSPEARQGILLIAAALGVLAFAFAPLSAKLVFLGALFEDISSWVKGDKLTLSEQVFGPWATFREKYVEPVLPVLRDVWDVLKQLGAVSLDILVFGFRMLGKTVEAVQIAIRGIQVTIERIANAWAFLTGKKSMDEILGAGPGTPAAKDRERHAMSAHAAGEGEQPQGGVLARIRHTWNVMSGKEPALPEFANGVANAAKPAPGTAMSSSHISLPGGSTPGAGPAPTAMPSPSVQIAPPVVNAPPAQAPNVSSTVHVDNITLQGAPSDPPEDWGRRLWEEFNARQLQDAHAAAAR